MKNQRISLWMNDFVKKNSNQSVINLSSNISDYWNIEKYNFYQQLKKLSPRELIGIRNNNLEVELKNEIRNFLKISKKIDNDNIIFGFGSYSIMEKLAWKLLPKGLMIGEFPQFKYFPMEYILAGGKYRGLWQKDFTFPYQNIIEELNNNKLKVIYINNPNNPTGNTISKSMLLDILKKAFYKNKIVIIDEVYGDLLPTENSLSRYVNKYSNLLVLRSFSKSFGIQNLRLGYLIAGKEIINKYKKICNWNEASNIAVLLSLLFLKDKKYINYLKTNTLSFKKMTINLFIKKGFEIMPTNPLVPLMFIKSSRNINLKEYFNNKNIIVNEPEEYTILYKNFPLNYCRIRVPINMNEFINLKKRLSI